MRKLLPVAIASLLPLGILGCPANPTAQTKSISLKFAAQMGDTLATCGANFDGLGTTAVSAQLLDARFYVSNIRLINSDGDEVPLTLTQDGKWQTSNVALLDFEDGCGDLGTTETNSVVTGTVPDGSYSGVRFDIGVPFELNHDDIAASPSPLNVSSMFWSWAGGHKFIRVDLRKSDETQWSMHLGSTMCDANGPASAPVSGCAHPNRPTVAFDSMDVDTDTIVFDIQKLFSASDLATDTPDSAAGCQSFSDDVNECTSLFPMLGLAFSSGVCTDDCANQIVFQAESGFDRGRRIFTTARATQGGQVLACANCHSEDGSGNIGPDIRADPIEHLIEHRAPGPHPQGVKFTTLTQAEYDDLHAYLSTNCANDPNCEPFGGHEEHE